MTRLEKLFQIARKAYWLRALLLHGVAASTENGDGVRDVSVRTVVDIGASRGQFSLLLRGLFPAIRIAAFEPLPSPADIYRRVFAADANVTLHECAIGDMPGDFEIHVSAEDDSSSLLPITDVQTRTFPGTDEVGTTKVSVKTLSDVLRAEDIQAPALMKIDVQGYELNALKGSESLLHCFDWVYCECSFVELYCGQALADEVVAWLYERGFSLQGVYNVAYDRGGKAVQADFLFKRR